VFRIHDLHPCGNSPSSRFLVRGAHHFIRQVNANDLSRLANLLSARKEDSPASARHVQRSLSYLNFSCHYETPAKMRKASRACVILSCNSIELSLGSGLTARRVVIHLRASNVVRYPGALKLQHLRIDRTAGWL
jgi:hypothetical protein